MLSPYTQYRIYEMLPGISIWATLVFGIVASFVWPIAVMYFMILFYFYWLLRVVNFSFYLFIAWYRLRVSMRTSWKDKLRHEIPEYTQYKHVVFLTLYNESWEVVRPSLEHICDAVYDPSVITLVIAGEAKKEAHYTDILSRIREEFGGRVADIVGTLHPSDLPDEIPGKGSNLHFSERYMQSYIDEKGWSYDTVIATIFDIDTICHSEYFAYLTYAYAKHPRPTRSSFQPIALYNNNIWESPAMVRIMAFGTTFWIMTSLTRQDSLVTFSSHSMSFEAIVDAGFHEKRIVSEDSRIFYQCFLAYDGDYEVTPLYLPVSMDTVRDDSWTQSLKNLYKQQRRWAWGVEHVPFLLTEFRKKGRAIPWYKKFKWVFLEWEGKWSWSLVAILITVLGRLPVQPWVAGDVVAHTALFVNVPHVLERLMNLSLLGLFLSAIFSMVLLPKRPDTHGIHHHVLMVLQWALMPIVMIALSAIPAIDAATHLVFGKYLGFNVSQKQRKTQPYAPSS